MKRIILTLALVATVMLFASPIVAEASEPIGSPTVEKACSTCHAIMEAEVGTDLGHMVDSLQATERIAMEVTAELPIWSAKSKAEYAEVTPFGHITLYATSYSASGDKVPI